MDNSNTEFEDIPLDDEPEVEKERKVREGKSAATPEEETTIPIPAETPTIVETCKDFVRVMACPLSLAIILIPAFVLGYHYL